jgi:hypothetical protein
MPEIVTDIELPLPPYGRQVLGPGRLLEDKGILVLERAPGVIRTIACTHAGVFQPHSTSRQAIFEINDLRPRLEIAQAKSR